VLQTLFPFKPSLNVLAFGIKIYSWVFMKNDKLKKYKSDFRSWRLIIKICFYGFNLFFKHYDHNVGGFCFYDFCSSNGHDRLVVIKLRVK